MIRCAWFLTDLRIGGAERIPLALLPEQRGFQGSVILLKDVVEQEIPPGLEVIPLGPADGRVRGRLLGLLGRALRASRGADLLVGGMEGTPIVFAAVCALGSGRPVVGIVPTNLERYAAAVRMGRAEWMLLRWALRRCRAIITASEDGREALRKAGVRAERIHVIPNPVSPWTRDVRRDDVRRGGVTRLLTVGRLEPVKGMDVILEAAHRLVDLPIHWEIIGDGSEAAALSRRIEALGLSGRVRLAGRVDDLRPHFERADVFVLASRVEGMSIAMLEAMATGLPVIATRSGQGVEEALGQGTSGMLVPPEDPEALAEAVRALCMDPERARSLGQAARLRARAFDPATIAEAYGRVFVDSVGSRGPERDLGSA